MPVIGFFRAHRPVRIGSECVVVDAAPIEPVIHLQAIEFARSLDAKTARRDPKTGNFWRPNREFSSKNREFRAENRALSFGRIF
jgi:hypothetical protein